MYYVQNRYEKTSSVVYDFLEEPRIATLYRVLISFYCFKKNTAVRNELRPYIEHNPWLRLETLSVIANVSFI